MFVFLSFGTSFNIILSRPINFSTNFTALFSLHLNSIQKCMYITCSLSIISWWASKLAQFPCYCEFRILSSDEHMALWSGFYHGHMPRSGGVGSYGSYSFKFLRNLHIDFHSSVLVCTSVNEESFPHPRQYLLLDFVMTAILTRVRHDVKVASVYISLLTGILNTLKNIYWPFVVFLLLRNVYLIFFLFPFLMDVALSCLGFAL